MTGIINSIQHFSTGDGPGIRTTVFFQGCGLHCDWCHNPETIPMQPVLLYYSSLCTGCGVCKTACPRSAHTISGSLHKLNRELCTACGKCAAACGSGALQLSGRRMTVEEVLTEILADQEFYEESGGGVTLSGGEPLLQPDFAAAVAKECRANNIHVIIDTAGHVPFSSFRTIIPYASQFYFDLKAADSESFFKTTGGDLEKIRQNLKSLAAQGCDITARIPVIPGHNFSDAAAERMAQILKDAGIKSACLLPFHRLGSGKYNALSKKYIYSETEPLAPEALLSMQQIFSAAEICCRIEK